MVVEEFADSVEEHQEVGMGEGGPRVRLLPPSLPGSARCSHLEERVYVCECTTLGALL